METHRIYFEKRCIIICPQDEAALSDPNAIIFCLPYESSSAGNGTSIIHELVNLFEKSDSLHRVYVPSEHPELTYNSICAEFVQVNAGGGLVSNRRGDYLLIRRNDLCYRLFLAKGFRWGGDWKYTKDYQHFDKK